jgi:hypothetical protein
MLKRTIYSLAIVALIAGCSSGTKLNDTPVTDRSGAGGSQVAQAPWCARHHRSERRHRARPGERGAHRLLRLRQLHGQARVPVGHRRPCAFPQGQPAAPHLDRRPHRRARRPRIQPGAGPEALRSRAPCAHAAGRERQPDRSRELRQGKARRPRAAGEEVWAQNRRAEIATAGDARAVLRGAALAAALLCVSAGSQAALFEDDEARRAILDLRQRVEAMRQQTDQRLTDENGQLRRSLLDLQNQIEQMRGDLARMTGQNEQLTRTLSDMQSRQKDTPRRQAASKRAGRRCRWTAASSTPTRRKRRLRGRAGRLPRGRVRAGADRLRRIRQALPAERLQRPRRCSGSAMRSTPRATTTRPSPTSAPCCSLAPDHAGARGRAVDRQLPDRAEGHARRAPHAGRPDQGLPAVRSRTAPAASGSRACADAAELSA